VHISPSFVISLTYGDSHFVPFGANKTSSRENHIPKERVSGISCFHDVSHCDAPLSAETQVMHFIARFNSSVRLFNQTSLPALLLNVGGCDPFRRSAVARGSEDENHFVRRIRTFVLSALCTPARRHEEGGPGKTAR